MISTGTLMLSKAILTASAALGFCFWQLWSLKRLREERERHSHSREGDSAPTETESSERQAG